jgi:hypothetical protein
MTYSKKDAGPIAGDKQPGDEPRRRYAGPTLVKRDKLSRIAADTVVSHAIPK